MNFKQFVIRPATNADIPAIKNIVFSVLEEYKLQPSETGKDIDLNDIDQNYFASGGYFGVAIITGSNEIVGTFGLYAVSPAICELRKMYLLKSARGKGLGKYILAYAISLAREKQFRKIVLETISPLKEAIALYRATGFREVEPAEKNDRVDQAFELELSY